MRDRYEPGCIFEMRCNGPWESAVYACEYGAYDAPAQVVIADVVVAVEVAWAWVSNAVASKMFDRSDGFRDTV